MSQVEKLVAKALSTSSEEEAFTALRIARKKYAGDSVAVKNSGGHDWEGLARQYYGLAIDRDKRMKSAIDRADYFMKEMTQAQVERSKYSSMYYDAENRRKFWMYSFFVATLLAVSVGGLFLAYMMS